MREKLSVAINEWADIPAFLSGRRKFACKAVASFTFLTIIMPAVWENMDT